jgi:hypothetical protein
VPAASSLSATALSCHNQDLTPVRDDRYTSTVNRFVSIIATFGTMTTHDTLCRAGFTQKPHNQSAKPTVNN